MADQRDYVGRNDAQFIMNDVVDSAGSIRVAGSRSHVMQLVLSLDPGGTERLVIELAKRAHACFQVSVCCLDELGAWAPELMQRGIDVFALRRRPGFRPSLSAQIARELSRRRVQVLHCHHYTPLVYGSLARILHPATRLVFTEHGRLSDAPPSLKRRLVTPFITPLVNELYAVSDDLRSYLRGAGFSSRMAVITNGVEVGPTPSDDAVRRARKLLGAAPAVLVIAAVGRLDPVKDIRTLLSAFSLLDHRLAQLVLIGDGPEREGLLRRASELGVRERVRFLGHRDDVRELLPGVDIFVNASISEGISLTLLEAMAARLPIIATAVGGTPEVVMDGQTGRLTPPRDPAALKLALEDLLGDPQKRQSMGNSGRNRVETLFTLDRMAGQYLAAYARLAK